MKSNGMTNKNPVTHPRSDFSPYRKKFMMHLKFEPNRIFISLKKASMSEFLKSGIKRQDKKDMYHIYHIQAIFGYYIISYILHKKRI